MKIFDYLFYRIAKYFYRKDGSDATRAIGILTVIQGLFIGEFAIIFSRLIYGYLAVANYSKLGSKIGAGLGICLFIFNYFLYKDKYWRLADKWRNKETSLQLQIRGILVVLVILLPFMLLFWLGTTGYRNGENF